MSSRRTFVLPAALALGAVLALTACGPDSGDAGAAPQASAPASAPGAPAPGDSAAPGTAAGGTASGGTAAGGTAPGGATKAPASAPTPARPANPGGGTGGAGGGAGEDDPYGYSHLCTNEQLTVKVSARAEAPSQRVIEVHNKGPKACGLDYYPEISIGDSHAAYRDQDILPMVPSGLGGPPAYVVGAGKVAYAVVDLNPGGASGGAAGKVDELNVLARSGLPTAYRINAPLTPGTKVSKPKLGLYRSTVPDAAASAATADHQL
ncbi:DUF4232 domain-containing protein [Streptomyces sp. NRRL WC-3742]|uniref:DUF4232 domain-containing protein n=1 Tax=Streptomyces sp. NRRL WC-3742 TaxID=1463934 RepID=UPI0004CAE46D|nr:DUF4232 domain-containing protein [Streptomyces sp. NRRL WC-3742]